MKKNIDLLDCDHEPKIEALTYYDFLINKHVVVMCCEGCKKRVEEYNKYRHVSVSFGIKEDKSIKCL